MRIRRVLCLVAALAVVVCAASFFAGCNKKGEPAASKPAETATSEQQPAGQKEEKTEPLAPEPQASAPQAGSIPDAPANEPLDKVKARLKPGLYAVIDTSMGRIICELYPKAAPIGVGNFVGLAEGTMEWVDPKTGNKVKRPFYDGLIFHRVIPGFMIQGGDPLGTGMGGPGYRFKNEVSDAVRFDRAGRLAYANAGPDSNGSQFFITHNATPNLNGNYTIFGQCIEGQSVVVAIGNVERDSSDRPLKNVVMKKVTILRPGGGK